MAHFRGSVDGTPPRSGFFNSFGSVPSPDGHSMSPEAVHENLLDTALREHNRVREQAIRVFQNNQLREAQLKLLQEERQEKERLRLEQELADDRARIIELRKKTVPIPELPPRVKTPPPPPAPPTPPTPEPPQKAAAAVAQPQAPQQAAVPQAAPVVTQPVAVPQAPQTLQPAPSTIQAQPVAATQAPAAAAPITISTEPPPYILPGAQRYLEIHQNLKRLRHFIIDNGKKDPALKKKTGEMRREIRKSVGQLTSGRGATTIPKGKIHSVLLESLRGLQSPPVDPNMVTVTPRAPVDGAVNNGELPALFIYLMNIFAKAVVAQFIDEAGVTTKAAEPLGVVAVSIFANKDFVWRNESLIDILMCKMRVSCPVLFGLRGNEKTEEGRARLGWKKDGGQWVSDQVHNTRMTGLGAGYAAIALRDFSKTQMKNPWSPSNYWRTLASIVDTPPEEASNTQYRVLKVIIENSEQRFLQFYGDVGRHAMFVALVVFPARALDQSVAVKALAVLGDKLRRDVGLQFKLPTPRIGGFSTGRPIWG
ncbi:hypothetical protein VE04_08816 [Pseudogymnoascus sp. 24MN13]|nr:hypothetical protein VE04_08816 [Pseudogymnoascus sp. 24MN13]